MSSQKRYITHLDGLKGLACVMIMAGHYIGLYRFAEYFPGDMTKFQAFLDSSFGFLLDEQFYVKLFFIVSGYLVAMSHIDSIMKLLKKCLQRFLRLGLPILFAYAIIRVLYQTIGFHTAETEAFVVNSWLQTMYVGEFTLVEVLTSPIDVLFFNNTVWNAPYWVLREMFYSSLIIYTLSYLRKWLKNKYVFMLAGIGVLLGISTISEVATACILGMLLCWFEKDFSNILEKRWFPIIPCLMAVGFYMTNIIYFYYLIFGVAIIFIPKIKWINKTFSSKLMMFLGKISFGIYSFHWPVFCSLGLVIFMKVCGSCGAATALVISGVCTTAVTLIISVAYYYVLEKPTYKLIGRM